MPPAAAGKPYNRPAGVGKQANLAPLEEMHSPLWWLAPPPSPHFVVGLWMLNHGAKSLQESMEQFILSPGWGKVRRSRIRGSREAANYQNDYYAI